MWGDILFPSENGKFKMLGDLAQIRNFPISKVKIKRIRFPMTHPFFRKGLAREHKKDIQKALISYVETQRRQSVVFSSFME